MSGTTTTDPNKALLIPFKSLYTLIELDEGFVVLRNRPGGGGGVTSHAASDIVEANTMTKKWDEEPKPAAPVMTSMQIGGKSIAIPQGATATVPVSDAPTQATG